MKLIDILVRELPHQGGWPSGVGVISQHLDGGIFFDKGRVIYRDGAISISQSDDGWSRENCSADNSVSKQQYESSLAATKEQKMNWKYIKGSEKDFAGAPYNETHAFMHKECCHFIYTSNPEDIRADLFSFIAQREPVAEWDGAGLPPVGCDVEFILDTELYTATGIIPENGQVVNVVAHKTTSDGNDVAVVYWDDSGAGRAAAFIKQAFRPIKSEADKKRDAAIEWIRQAIDAHGVDPLNSAKSIYDSIEMGAMPGVILDKSK